MNKKVMNMFESAEKEYTALLTKKGIVQVTTCHLALPGDSRSRIGTQRKTFCQQEPLQ